MLKREMNFSMALVLAVFGTVTQAGEAIVSPLNTAQDLDLSGRIVYAINFGNNGNPKFGDFVFSQDQDYPRVTVSATAEGVGVAWGGLPPDTGDPDLDRLLDGLIWTNNGPGQCTTSISVGGLTVGVKYQLQLIFYDPMSMAQISRPLDITVEGEMIVEDYDMCGAQGGISGEGGSLVKYVFTARDRTLNIDITPIPDDSSLASGINGLILTALVPDFNNDWSVDIEDLLMLIEHWGRNEPALDFAPELTGDGVIDRQDLEAFMSHWGEELNDPMLLSHWRLDETNGTIASDSAGSQNASLIGTPIWQPSGGKIKGTLQFDGIDDYAATDFVLNPSQGSFSVFAWVKGGGPGQVILSQRDEDPKKLGASWLACDPATGCLMTTLIAASGRNPLTPMVSQSVITDGAWHHVGLVSDEVYRYLYVDGKEVIRDLRPYGTLKGTRAGLNLGAGKNLEPGSFWSGLIDDVRIYDRVVTPSDF